MLVSPANSGYQAPSVTVASALPKRKNDSAVLIVPVVSGEDEDATATVVANPFLDAEAVGEIEVALKAFGAKGGAEQVTRVVAPSLTVASVVAVGLGKNRDEWPADMIRRAAGVAARSLNGTEAVITTLSDIDLSATIEGLILGAYRFIGVPQRQDRAEGCRPARDHRADRRHQGQDQGRGRPGRRRSPPRWPPPAIWSTPHRAICIRPSSPSAQRLWVNLPAWRSRCSTTKTLTKDGYGGVIGVGKGSSRPPRLVRLTHRGSEEQEGQEGRAGRQGHHVRHRRHLHQAGRQHAPHDLRHGRSRGGHRHRGAGRQTAVADRRRSPPCRWPRTCRRRPRSGPAMC